MKKKAKSSTLGHPRRPRASRSGHLPVELGRGTEDDFNLLLERLGFRVLRKRTDSPGIDFVAEFTGSPAFPPELGYRRVMLQRPIFAADGKCAFSVKRGGILQSDVTELLRKTKMANRSHDTVMRSITSAVIVTNQFMTESEIDGFAAKGVFCWDIKRLCFYAAKSRIALQLSDSGPVKEIRLPDQYKSSFLQTPAQQIDRATLLVNVSLFVDDHAAHLGHDHVGKLLEQIYPLGIKGIAESTNYQVQVQVSMHVLGRVERDLALNAYVSVGANRELHPDVTFAAPPTFEIYQYASAPWAPIVRLPFAISIFHASTM